MITGQNENSVIFLLGAGASVDASMPAVAQLTNELKRRLSNQRLEFEQVFELIEKNHPSVNKNYEHFFEWISLLLRVNKEPFNKLIHAYIDAPLINAMADLASVLGEEVAGLLSLHSDKPEYDPRYLSRLGYFLPKVGRLKVFTLNYDCCVEDACHTAGIDITTGFDPITKKWHPSLFETNIRGINLYKLHGSLRWFPVRNNAVAQNRLYLMEFNTEERLLFQANYKEDLCPELVLGPGNKVQHDDPFRTLYHEFHKSMLKAKMCVVIGFGYGDPHIRDIIDEAVDMKTPILNVNSEGATGRYFDVAHYHHLMKPAKEALLEGWIDRDLSKLYQTSKESARGRGAIADNF